MAKTEESPKVVDDKKEAKVEPKKEITVQGSLKSIVALLESTVKAKDTRMLAGRLHRQTATIRAKLTPEILSQFVSTYLSEADAKASKSFLLEHVSAPCRDLG